MINKIVFFFLRVISGPYSILNTDQHVGSQPKRKRSWSRAVFSNLQRKGLEKRFEVQKYVTKPDRRQLAAMLGLTDAQVITDLRTYMNVSRYNVNKSISNSVA